MSSQVVSSQVPKMTRTLRRGDTGLLDRLQAEEGSQDGPLLSNVPRPE